MPHITKLLNPIDDDHIPELAIMADIYCSDCKRNTEVVFDHSAGDTVCSECGLVLEAHSIDEASEWWTFANESGDTDPVRVGDPTNPFLVDKSLVTVIMPSSKNYNGGCGPGDFGSSRWLSRRGSNPDSSFLLAFKAIAVMADRQKHVSHPLPPHNY